MGVSRKLRLLQKTARIPVLTSKARLPRVIRESLRVIDVASDPIIITSTDNTVVYINSQAELYLGLPCAELSGEMLDDHFRLAPVSRLAGGTQSRLAGEREDGETFDVPVDSRDMEIDGQQFRIVTMRPGRTAQIESHDFADAQKLYDAILKDAPLGYQSLDKDGKLIEVNQTWLRSLGYSESEVIGRWFGEVLLDKYVDCFKRNFLELKKRGHVRDVEVELLRKDGSAFNVIFEGRAVYDKHGDFLQTRCIFYDITDRKRAEKNAMESEERFRLLAEVSPDAICVHIDRKIVFMNDAGAKLLGACDPSELIGRDVLDFVHRQDRESVTQRLEKVLHNGKEATFVEQKLVRLDGRIVEVETASVPLTYDGKRAVQVVSRDISERKRFEKILQESEKRYRTIVQDQTELVCRWTPDGKLTFVNEAYCRYFGKSADDMVGRSFMSLIPDSDHEKVEQHFETFEPKEPVQTHQHRVLGADGEIRWQQWTNRAIFDDEGRLLEVQSTGSDITKLKQAEEKLQYRLEFERLIMTLSSGFIALAPEEIGENITNVLRKIGEFTGADRCYLFKLSDDGKLLSNTHEWCANGVEPQIEYLQNHPTEAFSYSLRIMKKGEAFHVPRVADLPDEASAERGEFEREGIKSVICVPTERQGQVTGFLGLDSVRREKIWSDDEIGLLKVVGEMLTTALEREDSERALRTSEERYRTFVQNFQGIAYHARMDWVPLFFHGAVEEITGYTEEDFTAGKPRWDQIIHPEDWSKIQDSAHKIAKVPNFSVEREYRILHKNGETRWVHEQTQNICDESGQPHVVSGAIYDITEQKHAAEALGESEQRFRTMADFTYDWEYWLGTDGKCVYVSPSIESTTGYRAEEFQEDVGLLRRITHREDLQILDRHLADEAEPEKVTSIDFRITTREGEERWINHVCRAVYDKDGDYLGRRASNRDITDRKLAEDALRRERDRAQRYLDVAGTVLLVINPDERVVLVNRKGCQVLGFDELEVIGKNWFDQFLPVRVRESARKKFRRLTTGETMSAEYTESPVITCRGEERTIAWYNTLIRDENGNIKGTLSSGSDITERKRMEKVQSVLFEISEATILSGSLEELLATIHKILGKLIDTTNFYVALYDAANDRYTFPYLVDEYHKDADLPPEQLKKTLTNYVRRTGLPLLADDETDEELRASGQVGIVGQPSKVWLGVPLKTSQGVIGVVAVQSYTDPTLYQESDMDLMTFVSRHITMAIERKVAEEALRESEEHFRSLVETMSEGMMVRGNDNIISFANKMLCEMIGYSAGEVVGSHVSAYFDDENWKVVTEQLAARLDGSSESYELDWTCKDGTSITTIMSPEPVRDPSGAVVGSFAVITDISERKHSEDRLRQATNLLRTEREALTQKNIALKEILDHIEKERQDYKQTICKDVEQAISPILTRLKMLADRSRAHDLEALETHLEAILAKDVDVFRDRYSRLTPRELEICELIKAKMSSKEISERLNVSLLTVHKHREQIRRKLGINSKGINLSTYLQSH